MRKICIILISTVCLLISNIAHAQSSVTAEQLEGTKWQTTQYLGTAPTGTKSIELAFDRCPKVRLIYLNEDPCKTKVEYWRYGCKFKQPDLSNLSANIEYEVFMLTPDDELGRVAPIVINGRSLTVQFGNDFNNMSDITFIRK